MKKHLFVWLVLMLLALAAAPAWAQRPPRPAQPSYPNAYVYPPRFQIYEAPRPYGGLVMLDTQTGETYQRVVVNTPHGIAIRWIKTDKTPPKKGETILWQ